MTFLNPWGFLSLLLVIPVILLYLLKQKHTDVIVSSTMLWQEALRDLQAVRPWQRLVRNLLLILQILAIALFALALSKPSIRQEGKAGHQIIIVDLSAGMQAVDVKPSRMERARNDIKDRIRNISSNSRMTIIAAGSQAFAIVNKSSDKNELLTAVENLRAGNGRGSLKDALFLAESLRQEDGGDAEIHVFSGQRVEAPETDTHVYSHLYNGDGVNAAVTDLSYSMTDDGSLTALSNIANYGEERTLTLELRVDGYVNDIREATVPAGESVSIYWNNIPSNAAILNVNILDNDDLKIDNSGWAAVNESHPIKALLVTQRNVFLERAVTLREDIRLSKANRSDAGAMDGFQLNIYDGYLPDKLPESSHFLIFNPSKENGLGLNITGTFAPKGVRISHETDRYGVTDFLEPDEVHIAEAVLMEVPPGFSVCLEDEKGTPLLLAGELNGRKTAIFTFELQKSNLPLKADFPILIQNIISWMFPPTGDNAAAVYSGEPMPVNPLPLSTGIAVFSPGGTRYSLPVQPDSVFYETGEPGVYEIQQIMEDKTLSSYFTVKIPTKEVSDLNSGAVEASPGVIREQAGRETDSFKAVWQIAGMLLVILLLAEWWVYTYGL